MVNAIAILQDLLGYEEEAEAKVEIHEAIAELQAHKAKIDELKEWCKDHSRNTAATKYDKYWKGYQESAIFVLQKLEELQKST